ncbi:MAG: RNA polymerase factor sigma-54 [Sphaerochaetaceae bacterium]|nr:RNA polymerase factor sigma-54 [Sphaerochaetaceae bacterium]
MEISLNTSLKQEQQLSPQMIQSLALLNLPVTELRSYIQKEIEENPALEIPESDLTEYPEQSFLSYGDDEDRQSVIENTGMMQETLSEHLLKQLGECNTTESLKEAAKMLIGNLDANGFFIVPLQTLFEKTYFSKKDINAALETVQSFDPCGICVENFRESLILQAKYSSMAESDLKIFSNIVNLYLEKVNAGKYKEVANALHISCEDVETFVSILKSFTPYPGSTFDNQMQPYAVPEFSIHVKNKELTVEMSRANLPDLVLSESFREFTDSVSDSKETALYVNNSIKRAKTLISQVQMRYRTMYSAAIALSELQKDFFFEGPEQLKVLTLKQLADKIGVHESTVSRLAQSKWIDTDWGLFQMKYFFSLVVSAENGNPAVSRNAVKSLIGDILKSNPKLSDQKISDLLLEKGIRCARRTVNKYREELRTTGK